MGSKLYVGNLSFDITEQELRQTFSEDGREVSEVAIITDRETQRPRGFAFVTMASAKDAQGAIAALDGRSVAGRAMKVSEAQERTGGGGGGGRSGGGYRNNRY